MVHFCFAKLRQPTFGVFRFNSCLLLIIVAVAIGYLIKKIFFFVRDCAAEAIFCCPTENSHHLKSLLLSKNAEFRNEKESKRIRARCQVSLEKSSKNYSRCENEPSQATCKRPPSPPPPSQSAGVSGGFSTWWSRICRIHPPWRPAILGRHF